eukprot:5293624-Amphidinium_carterae.1
MATVARPTPRRCGCAHAARESPRDLVGGRLGAEPAPRTLSSAKKGSVCVSFFCGVFDYYSCWLSGEKNVKASRPTATAEGLLFSVGLLQRTCGKAAGQPGQREQI